MSDVEAPSADTPTDVAPDTAPTIVDTALAQYDAAVSPVTARFSGIGLISHSELLGLSNAIRQGLANALRTLESGEAVTQNPEAAPEDLDQLEDQLAAQEDARIAAEQAAANTPLPVVEPAANSATNIGTGDEPS